MVVYRPVKTEKLLEFADLSRAIYVDGPYEETTRSGLDVYTFRFRPLETLRFKYQIDNSMLDPIDGLMTKSFPRHLCSMLDPNPAHARWFILCNYNLKLPTSGNLIGFGEEIVCDECSQPILDKIGAVCPKCLQPTDNTHEIRTYERDGKKFRVRINRNKISRGFLVNKKIYLEYQDAIKEVMHLRRENARLNMDLKKQVDKDYSVHDKAVHQLSQDFDKIHTAIGGAPANRETGGEPLNEQ